MSRNLFAYGTLQFPAILEAVCGLVRDGEPATLAGFRREGVRGEPYPAIVPDAGGIVTGVVYRELPVAAFVQLDRFEGDEYRRLVRNVRLANGASLPASCYVLDGRWQARLDGRPWQQAEFERVHLARYVERLRRE